MNKILILGGGFAAVAAAEELARSSLSSEITIVSSSRAFVFYPALVPYVFGDFDIGRDDLTFDLGSKLAEKGIRFIQGEVISLDPQRKTVTVTGDDLEGLVHFDYLIITLGRRLATEKIPGFFENAKHLLGISAAERFRDSIEKFTSGDIVVGLCPNGYLPVPVCESALALSHRFRDQIAGDEVSVTAVFPETIDDAFLGSTLFRDLRTAFDTSGVRVVERFPITSIESKSLTSDSGEELAYDLAMLVPPFRGQASLVHLGAGYDPQGFVKVDEYLKVAGHENIFAAGDILSLSGPRFGYMAIRQGKVAAANVLAAISSDHSPTQYEHKLAWAVGEKYSDPIYFHYGFWDESLDDFDENAFFGMAKNLREKYGPISGFGKPLGRTAN